MRQQPSPKSKAGRGNLKDDPGVEDGSSWPKTVGTGRLTTSRFQHVDTDIT